jgi:hypothetical protein
MTTTTVQARTLKDGDRIIYPLPVFTNIETRTIGSVNHDATIFHSAVADGLFVRLTCNPETCTASHDAKFRIMPHDMYAKYTA